MCKSTEICDETQNHDLKIFFRAYLWGQVFLVIFVYKREIRGRKTVHRMVYFLLLKKIAKKALLIKPQQFSPDRIYSKFQKKKLKLEKRSFKSFFFNVDSFKSYKGLKLNIEKA